MKQYSLKQIQAAYKMNSLKSKLSKQQSENVCGHCWQSHCSCNYDHKQDAFINLTTASEPVYV